MAEIEVRSLTAADVPEALRVVSDGMLGDMSPAVVERWGSFWKPEEGHGAFTPDGQVVGVTRWFRDEAKVPGTSVPAAGVTAVAVRSTHRRRGVLTALMHAQLEHIRAAGVPLALLVAAEWPIYGRFGYGAAIDACGYEIDTSSAELRDPPVGSIELLLDHSDVRPHLEAVHRMQWERAAGSLLRDQPLVWDYRAGVEMWPAEEGKAGLRRSAIWRNESGEVRGAVTYSVEEKWPRNRPKGTAEVHLLVADSPVAERELWRHLCTRDWIATVTAGLRAVDDPLPLFLTDSRAAAQVDRSDAIWARILDVPAVFAARRAPVTGRSVVEVRDPLGYADGRWALELGPDRGSAQPTEEPAEVRLPVSSLGALYFGGTTATRLTDAGEVDELVPGGAARLSALLATPRRPWSTTSY